MMNERKGESYMSTRQLFQKVSHGKLLYRDSLYCLISHKKKLIVSEYLNDKIALKIEIVLPMSGVKKFLSYFRIFIRVFRIEPRMAIKFHENSFLISFLGALYFLEKKNENWLLIKEHEFRAGMNNPLALIKLNALQGFKDCIVYGEYWGNPDQEKVSIVQKTDIGSWHIAYSFPPHTIKHIHGLVPDYKRNCVYILTGDSAHESGIWKAQENFSIVEPLLIGSQSYRSCIAFPIKLGLLFATDTPLENNYLCILYLDGENKGKVEKLHDLEGSCIYGTMLIRDGFKHFVFSTTVEQDSRRHGIRYLLSWKRGPGIKSNKVKCLTLSEEDVSNFQCIAEFYKDKWPCICQFGAITFPNGNFSELYGSPIAVRNFDYSIVKIGI